MHCSESFTQNNEAIKVPTQLKSGKCGSDRTKIYFPDSFTPNEIKKNVGDHHLSQPVVRKQRHQKNNVDCYLIDNTNSSGHKTKARKTYSESFEPKRSLERVCQDSSIQGRFEGKLYENSSKTAVTNTLLFEGNKDSLFHVDKDGRYILNPFKLYSNKKFLSAKSAQMITFQDDERTFIRREIAEDHLFPNTDQAFINKSSSSYRPTSEQNEVYNPEIANYSQIPVVREKLGCEKTVGVELTHSNESHRFCVPLSVGEKDLTGQDFKKTANSEVSSTHNNAWRGPSYTELATQAILSSPDKRKTLAEIYDWMSENVQYFKERKHYASSQGWKNAIRHTLSLRKRFVRVPRMTGSSNWYGSWWTVSDAYLAEKGKFQSFASNYK